MSKMDVDEKLREIKRSFRLEMNGAASASMRSKGLNYKLNWGVSVPRLREMAAPYGHDMPLAIALWKEDVRECKIMATYIMPAESMSSELVDVWMEQTHTVEMAELACHNLYQHLVFAPRLAYQCIASDDNIRQVSGYSLLSHLFAGGKCPNERGINEFVDQAAVALQSSDSAVRHAAYNSLMRFANLGLVYERIAQNVLRRNEK